MQSQTRLESDLNPHSKALGVTEALGEIGSVDAVPDLIQALQDPEVHVARALGQIATPEALETVKKYESRQ
ncbi:TPA: HEAT repeat domain-containing protein [Candidatus Poribacteria bacterium]|nr:HEAT repeat domain-containing protein [Candidatus Poribacteria bacterium]HIB92552.1 HEAT repeat domain-containing protein [Candidatus Poribacteria bacterium]HIO38731.1 HEAT repeat domain-containing protein [Rhodospirillales bacterium]